ncbi:winged helix-turn-helix domain-containing protein [Streptomyces parvus]|uniref:Helix-turn-helix transcriptional regulator n=1 Tax=Streptomyces parvus TaxID=66428 RepID=A0A5D4HZ79_9ACTN|nr:helix-turn-helix domain-containing protein [Streptomyces parvus]TYR45149.1 helix-turn-helix transcriptional regulator [Streptomyces parvus]
MCSHPLRMKLYRALFIARRATASQLAEQVDEAVSLVSYHLRKLAYAAVGRLSFDQHTELYRSFLDAYQSWSAEWRGAAFRSEYLARLTAGELAELSREMHELVRRYEHVGQAGESEGRENVALHLYGFPFHA